MRYHGWSEEEVEAPLSEEAIQAQKELDHILKPLYEPQCVKALEHMKDMLVSKGVVNPNDSQMAVGLKQGKLDMILQLLDSAERVNNGR